MPLGFVPRTDIHEVGSFLSYRWHPKTGPLQSWGPNSYRRGVTWNYGGDLQDWVVRFPVQFNFKRRPSAFYRHVLSSETVVGRRPRPARGSGPVQHVDAALAVRRRRTLSAGTRPNYFPAAGLAPFLGNYRDVALGVTIKPVSRLSIGETLLWSRLDGRDGTPAAGAGIFENRIVRSRANYQFTREWSLRAILDYNSLDPNVAVIDLERGRHFGADVLLTWLAQPGTAFYIGYTDGYDDLRARSDAPRSARTAGCDRPAARSSSNRAGCCGSRQARRREMSIGETASTVFTGMLHALDLRDWQHVRDAFADHVDVDYSSLFGVPAATASSDDQIGAWRSFVGAFDATQHLTGPFVVTERARTMSRAPRRSAPITGSAARRAARPGWSPASTGCGSCTGAPAGGSSA